MCPKIFIELIGLPNCFVEEDLGKATNVSGNFPYRRKAKRASLSVPVSIVGQGQIRVGQNTRL